MLRSKRSDRREKVCSVLAHAMNCFTSCSPFSFRLVPAAAWASSNLSRALLESPAYSENKASRTPVEVPGGLDSPLLERLEIVAHSSTRLVVDVCVAEAGCRTRGLPTVRGEHLFMPDLDIQLQGAHRQLASGAPLRSRNSPDQQMLVNLRTDRVCTRESDHAVLGLSLAFPLFCAPLHAEARLSQLCRQLRVKLRAVCHDGESYTSSWAYIRK